MDTYTITGLEEKTGLLRRTIHFYVKERMISPPTGKGGAAKYGEEHLLRLQVIRILREKNLLLDGIREFLSKMDLNDMRQFLSGAEGSRKEWDMAAIGRLIGREEIQARNISFATLGEDDDEQSVNLLATLPTQKTSTIDTWQRIIVAEGVELNLSTALPESTRKVVLELANLLRAKLEGKENQS